ncbi:MAG: YqgE/AlgH family protein, partial [Acidimicrobiales bacterium]
MSPSFRARLLVAAPSLLDPNFVRTVVLILEHNDEGALGVVLNRPSDIAVGAALPGWGLLAAEPSVVFLGGPVSPTGAICLGRSASEAGGEDRHPLFHGLGTVDLDGSPDDVAAAVIDLRVFAGHDGWGPEQREGEVDANAWFVVDAVPGDAVSAQPERLWESVLRRQGGA